MRVRPTLAVVATLAIAGCDGSPTDNTQRPTTPVDPMTAQAASTGCSSRCGYAIPVQRAGGSPIVFQVTEDARLLGHYQSRELWSFEVYTWSRQRGTVATRLGQVPGEGPPLTYSRNGWGQTVGNAGTTAAAWEPDGTPVTLRDPATRARIIGYGTKINENSVIVGNGSLEGASAPNFERPFRWHYREGFQFLLPPELTGRAADVNNAGTIVGGYIRPPARGGATWYMWTAAGGRRDMGPGEALGISENGHVIGTTDTGLPWLYTPQGEMVMLPAGWRAVDVNDWGEVLLAGLNPNVAPPGTCGAAVWYRGYGLLRLTSPLSAYSECGVASINSWGDVGGTVVRRTDQDDVIHAPVVWTWKNNAYRYVAQ